MPIETIPPSQLGAEYKVALGKALARFLPDSWVCIMTRRLRRQPEYSRASTETPVGQPAAYTSRMPATLTLWEASSQGRLGDCPRRFDLRLRSHGDRAPGEVVRGRIASASVLGCARRSRRGSTQSPIRASRAGAGPPNKASTYLDGVTYSTQRALPAAASIAGRRPG